MECARHGCHNDVVPKGPGQAPRFCSPTCRKADYRRRRSEWKAAEWRSVATGDGGEAALVNPAADPDVQVVAAVHETIMLRNTYVRLGSEARVELAVRCQSMAKAIGDGLLENFHGAVDDD